MGEDDEMRKLEGRERERMLRKILMSAAEEEAWLR